MIRKASIMSVYKDCYEEYEKRHDELWPEMEQVLKANGAHNYSIFLHHETGQLFAYVEVEDEERWDAISKTEVCQRWWAYMEPLMETNDDNSPVSVELKEVFHLQ